MTLIIGTFQNLVEWRDWQMVGYFLSQYEYYNSTSLYFFDIMTVL